MDYKVFVYVVVCCGFIAGVRADCAGERPGHCNTDNNENENDTEVCHSCTVNCGFQSGLCLYRQGCLDMNMTKWTAANGYAQADHSGGGCGAASFSALESRWVNVTTLSCVEFTFTSPLPYRLDVFFVLLNDTVLTMLNRSHFVLQEYLNYTVNFTLPAVVGKLQFRLYGGGGSSEKPRKLLQLHPVSLQEGRCQTPDLSFSDSPPNLCCGWNKVNWETTSKSNESRVVIQVNTTDTVAILTSALTRPTGEQRVDCLRFQYKMNSSDSSLNVSIKLMGGSSVTTWSTTGNGTDSWQNATMPIKTTLPYQVVFKSLRDGADQVALAHVKVTASNSSCDVDPPEADTERTVPKVMPPTCECSMDSKTDTTSASTHVTDDGSLSTTVNSTTPTTTTTLSTSQPAPTASNLPSTDTTSASTQVTYDDSFSATVNSTTSQPALTTRSLPATALSTTGEQEDDDDSSTAIIASTATVAVVLIVIVVAIVLRIIVMRQSKEEERRLETYGMLYQIQGERSEANGYIELRSPQPQPSSQTPPDMNYAKISEVTAQDHVPTGDKDSAFDDAVTEDGASGKGGNSEGDKDTHVDACYATSESGLQPSGTAEEVQPDQATSNLTDVSSFAVAEKGETPEIAPESVQPEGDTNVIIIRI